MQQERPKNYTTIFLIAGLAMAALTLFRPNPSAKGTQAKKEASSAPATKQAPAPETATAPPPENVARRLGAPLTPAQIIRVRRFTELETSEFRAVFSNVGGGLAHYFVKDRRFARTPKSGPRDMITTENVAFAPLRLELLGTQLPADAVWSVSKPSEREIRMVWEGDGLRVTRSFSAGQGPYQIWVKNKVENLGPSQRRVRARTTVFHYVPRDSEGGGFFAVRAPAVSNGLCHSQGSLERKDRDKLKSPHGYGSPSFVAIESVYFATVVADEGQSAERCSMGASDRGNPKPIGTLFEARLVHAAKDVAPGAAFTTSELAFVGPKLPKALARAGHNLSDVVDLGFFSYIARVLVALLSELQKVVGNWGIAIILLTVIVKLVLFPFTRASFVSMAKMRDLKPEMDRIGELYPSPADRDKKGAAVMELYRKHKINPASGCLPQLLQIPIWWALYQSLSTNIQLLNAEFIPHWLSNLAAPDPYFILPIALGILMWVQQKITPTTMDPQQAKLMLYMMPAMMTTFMLFLPSGLTVYTFTNSVLSILQQKLIDRQLQSSTPNPGDQSPKSNPTSTSSNDLAASVADGAVSTSVSKRRS